MKQKIFILTSVIVVLLILGGVFTFYSSRNYTGSKIFGTWYWSGTHTDREDEQPVVTLGDDFTVTLESDTGNKVFGTYSASHNNGARLDGCSTDDKGNATECITGTISGNTADVSYVSSYADNATGTATVVYNPKDDTLHWVVTQKAGGTTAGLDSLVFSDIVLKRMVK